MTLVVYGSADGGSDSTNNTTNRTATFSASVATGDLLYAVAATNNTSAHNLVISDNKSNSWTQIGDENDTRGLGVWQAVANSGSNGTTPIVTFGKAGSSVEVGCVVFAVSGEHVDLLDSTVVSTSNAGSTAPQISVGPNNFTNDLVIGVLVTRNVAFATATPLSGYTALIGNDSSGAAMQLRTITRATTTTGTWTPGWTLSTSTFWSTIAFIIKGSTTAPTITGTSSSTPRNGSSLTINGLNFGASQGTGTVTIGGTAQTVTSWADTAIGVTVAQGTNKYGVAVNTSLTINGGTPSNTYTGITGLLPQSGWDYINLGTPNATSAYRITAVSDLVSGDQLAFDTVGSKVIVYQDATFSADQTASGFDVMAWTTGNGYGAVGTQTLISAITSVTGINGITTIATVNGIAKASIAALNGYALA